MNNWKNEYYKNIKKLIVEHYAGETGYYSTAGLRAAERKLLSQIPRGSKILDVGCWSGRFSINAAKFGFDVLGVNITPRAIEVCKERATNENLYNANFKVLDITEEVPEGQFDYVFCPRFVINAISTNDRRRAAINNMYNACKPGGSMYVESFNIAYLGKGPIIPLKNIVIKFYRHFKVFLKDTFNISYKGLMPGGIVYPANKSKTASEGYAHLPTIFEVKSYLKSGKIKSIHEVVDGKKIF